MSKKQGIIVKIVFLLLALGIAYICTKGIVAYADDSIADVMDDWGNRNKPDSETMNTANGWISSHFGVLLSVIIYIIFALTFFTTACDLAYIAVPPLRPFLYSGGSDSQTGSNSSVFHGTTDGQVANNMQQRQANEAQARQNR